MSDQDPAKLDDEELGAVVGGMAMPTYNFGASVAGNPAAAAASAMVSGAMAEIGQVMANLAATNLAAMQSQMAAFNTTATAMTQDIRAAGDMMRELIDAKMAENLFTPGVEKVEISRTGIDLQLLDRQGIAHPMADPNLITKDELKVIQGNMQAFVDAKAAGAHVEPAPKSGFAGMPSYTLPSDMGAGYKPWKP